MPDGLESGIDLEHPSQRGSAFNRESVTIQAANGIMAKTVSCQSTQAKVSKVQFCKEGMERQQVVHVDTVCRLAINDLRMVEAQLTSARSKSPFGANGRHTVR